MNVVEITLASSGANFIQENEIFNQTFYLEFEWIEREGFWLLHISDERQAHLACGIKLEPNWPLYTHHEAKQPFSFMLLGATTRQLLNRSTLSQFFSLVAYEAF